MNSSLARQSGYSRLLAHFSHIAALTEISGLLSWDQEVMMPPNGAGARAEHMATLEAVTHERRTDPRIGEWLEQIDLTKLSDFERANVHLVRRQHERAKRIPAELATALARITSQGQIAWAKARESRSFELFAPVLSEILKLKREEAACLRRESGDHLYDCLLDDFEPGMRISVLQPLLENMRPRLTNLREQAAERSKKAEPLTGKFDGNAQMQLARTFADVVGYDWDSGRLDLSVHPFSSGTMGDARITTRIDEADPLGCLYSTLHELGHALYEQGLPREYQHMPIGHHVSMGVHESQSRLWENQIGRSAAFADWLYPHMRQTFPQANIRSPQHLYRILNHVETGFIRTEADEVHYNLHILLRFELERELISGELDVTDLEAEWNRRFERDFGRKVPDAANGVLQDVHWSAGLFGYFPTYSLGNIYAAQLHQKMEIDLGSQDQAIAQGSTSAILAWLRDNIHSKGSIYGPAQLVEQVCGQPVSAEPLLDYLETKFRAL